MSKVRLTATSACFQIRKKKWSKKPLVYRPCIFKFATSLFTQFREKLFSMQTTKAQISQRRSASAPAQFYQLSLESMIAKPATCKKLRIQTIPTGGGGGGGGSNCFSREVRTSFSTRIQMATYDFHGEVQTPCPPPPPPPTCLRIGPNKHTGSEVSAHIRVSNSLNSH